MLEKQKIIETDIARQLLSALLELLDEGNSRGGVRRPVRGCPCRHRIAPGRISWCRGGRAYAHGTVAQRRSRDLHPYPDAGGYPQADVGAPQGREVLVALAGLHIETVMPGFTHMQHAQPTTLAHHLLAYEQAFSRDFDRLRDAYVRVNLSPLGAAAFASTGYPINREYTASLLGFDGLVTNTMDAVATRDFALETLADLSILMVNTEPALRGAGHLEHLVCEICRA